MSDGVRVDLGALGFDPPEPDPAPASDKPDWVPDLQRRYDAGEIDQDALLAEMRKNIVADGFRELGLGDG